MKLFQKIKNIYVFSQPIIKYINESVIFVYIKKKFNLFIDSLISSFFTPQVMSILVIALLTYCSNEKIVDTITNTQARLLLQKQRMNSFEKQIMEVWIATQGLTFLFNSHEKKIKNSKKIKTNDKDNQNNKETKASDTLKDNSIIVDSEKIKNVYEHWHALKANWTANFSTNYEYVSAFPLEKTKKYCFSKEELLTDLQYQFKCRIDKMFKEEFFNNLENCYKNYYLKNKSCKTTLPSPQITNQLNNAINSFYLQISNLK